MAERRTTNASGVPVAGDEHSPAVGPNDDGYDVLIVAEAIPFHSLFMHHLTTDFR